MKHLVLLMLFLSLASSLHARQIIDLSTGQVTNDSVLQAPEKDVEYVGDGIVVDQKATIGMRCSSGVKVAYMFIGGVPSVNMKMFVSK